MVYRAESTSKKQPNNWYREWLGLVAAVVFLAICIGVFLLRPVDTSHDAAHTSLMNPVWEAINQSSDAPNQLEQLIDSTVCLQGYMIPIKAGLRHNTFLLSVLPINQCMFCGKDGIPEMIEVTMANQEHLDYSEQPLTLQGTIHLNRHDETRSEIQLRQAKTISWN